LLTRIQRTGKAARRFAERNAEAASAPVG